MLLTRPARQPRTAATAATATSPATAATAATATSAEAAAVPPARWMWLAAWPITAVFVLSNAATPLYVLWQHRIGFSRGTLTVVFAFYILGLLGTLPVAGIASDRLGRKHVLLPALAAALVASGLFATASSVVALMAARLLTGIAVGAAVSAGMAAVTDVAGPFRRHRAALLASTAMVFGAGLGPLLSGLLSEAGPAWTVFAVEAVLLLTAIAVVVRMPIERPAKAAQGARWVRVPGVPRPNRRDLAMGIAVFAPGITSTSFVLSLGPSLLSGMLGTDNRIVAGATAFVMFSAATGVQFAVRGLERTKVLLIGAASTLAGMAMLVVAVQTKEIVPLVAAAVLAGAGQGLGQLGGLSLLNANVPPQRLAEANAALNVGGYLLAGTLPVAAGYLSDPLGLATGSTLFAAVLATLAVIGAAVVAVSSRRRRP
ncbi:MFS transporter [Spirillospora sp. NPDC052269]